MIHTFIYSPDGRSVGALGGIGAFGEGKGPLEH